MATFNVSGAFSGVGSMTGSVIKSKIITGTFSGVGEMDFDPSEVHLVRNIITDFEGETGFELNLENLLIARSQVWWNKAYTYRRIVQIQPNTEGFEVGHPFYSVLSKDTIRQQKVRPDLSDIEVLRLVNFVPEEWAIVPRKISTDPFTPFITVEWPSESEIPPDTVLSNFYFIYYGNQDLVDIPETIDYDPPQWPVSYAYDARHLTYTRPGEHWVGDTANEDGAKVTMNFYGSKIRVLANTGPAFGMAEVQIDEGPWEFADLYSVTEETEQEVFLAEDLALGYHTIRYRRSGTKAPQSTGFEINLQKFEYLRHNQATNVREEADETLMWGSAIGGVVG